MILSSGELSSSRSLTRDSTVPHTVNFRVFWLIVNFRPSASQSLLHNHLHGPSPAYEHFCLRGICLAVRWGSYVPGNTEDTHTQRAGLRGGHQEGSRPSRSSAPPTPLYSPAHSTAESTEEVLPTSGWKCPESCLIPAFQAGAGH